jgi:hypothetical protein
MLEELSMVADVPAYAERRGAPPACMQQGGLELQAGRGAVMHGSCESLRVHTFFIYQTDALRTQREPVNRGSRRADPR